MNFGFSGEMIFLALLGLILFGPRRLPEIARTVGRFMTDLKRASDQFQSQVDLEVRKLELEEPAKAVASVTAPALSHEQLSPVSVLNSISEILNKGQGANGTPQTDESGTSTTPVTGALASAEPPGTIFATPDGIVEHIETTLPEPKAAADRT